MAKGGKFENLAAKELSAWFADGDKTQLVRSQLSGGWRTKHQGKNPLHQVGDLAANGPDGDRFREHFAVECKHHREISFWAHWTQKPGENIEGYWRKLIEEITEGAQGSSRPPIPLLFLRQNHRPILVGSLPTVIETCRWPYEMTEFTPSMTLSFDPWPCALIPWDIFKQTAAEDFYGAVEEVWRSLPFQ